MDYDMIEHKLLILHDLCVVKDSERSDDVLKWINWVQHQRIPNTTNPSAIIASWAHLLRVANLLYKTLKRK